MICCTPWVISPAWLKESFRARLFVDETPYILEDLECESKYRTDLKGAVLGATSNPGALLKGFEVCLAAHMQPPIDTLSAIVRFAGGNVICDVEKAKGLTKTINHFFMLIRGCVSRRRGRRIGGWREFSIQGILLFMCDSYDVALQKPIQLILLHNSISLNHVVLYFICWYMYNCFIGDGSSIIRVIDVCFAL